MVTLLQHCGNEGFKDYGEGQILSALEHLQRENEEYREQILRVFDQEGWNRIPERTKLLDIDGFLSVSGLKMLIGRGFNSLF